MKNDDIIRRIQVIKDDHPVVAAVLDILRQHIEKLEKENCKLKERVLHVERQCGVRQWY